MSGSEDTDPCLRLYRLVAECDGVAIRVLSTPDGRCLGTLETLLKFPQPIEALSYEIQTEFAQKKIGFVQGISGIEGSRWRGPVSTVTSNDKFVDNWLVRTSPKHWDGTPDVVLSSAAPSIHDGMVEVNNQNGSPSNRP